MPAPIDEELRLQIEELIEQQYRDHRYIESLHDRLRYSDAWNEQLRREKGTTMTDLERIASIEEDVNELVDGEISKHTLFNILIPLLFTILKSQARELQIWEDQFKALKPNN